VTYIDPAAKTLAHVDRLVDWRRGYKPAPVTIEWDLSNRCYLACQDCHFAYTHTRGPWVNKTRVLPMAHDRGGDLADTTLVMRTMRDASAAGVKSIVWTGGGEPTTHPRWVNIISAVPEYGLEQGMYTAGGLLTATTAKILGELASWVVVSLDAIDAETYHREKGVATPLFRAACNGIVHLVGHKATIGVSFLLHEKNWQKAPDMVRFARNLGATYTTLRPTIRFAADRPSELTGDRAWVSDAYQLLQALAHEPDVEVAPDRFAQMRDWTTHGYSICKGITLNTTITPDGRMWLCPNRREYPDSCLGDLRTESFAEIWARHPGYFQVDGNCRAMCRLHPVNQTIASLDTPRAHGAFI
jgi:MoaA/NifB/PqqE/SkfB family radical SAM enzyme